MEKKMTELTNEKLLEKFIGSWVIAMEDAGPVPPKETRERAKSYHEQFKAELLRRLGAAVSASPQPLRPEQAETASAPQQVDELDWIKAANHGSTMLAKKLLVIATEGQRGKFGGDDEQKIADWIGEHRAAPSVAGTQPTLTDIRKWIEKRGEFERFDPSGLYAIGGWQLMTMLESAIKSFPGAAQGTPQVEETARRICEALTKTKSNVGWMGIVSSELKHLPGAPAQPGPEEKRGKL